MLATIPLRAAYGDGRFAHKPYLLDRIQNPTKSHGTESRGRYIRACPMSVFYRDHDQRKHRGNGATERR